MPPRKTRPRSRPTRIEPPDILFIEAIRVVPKPPYHIQATDVLSVQLVGGFPTGPVGGGPDGDQYLVSPSGRIDLGPVYGDAGRVKVVGLTEDEAAESHRESLRAGGQGSAGLGATGHVGRHAADHRRAPGRARRHGQPGQLRLGVRGRPDAGRSHPGRQRAPGRQYLDNPQVSLSVFAYNSKVYYV